MVNTVTTAEVKNGFIKVTRLDIPEVCLIEPRVFGDVHDFVVLSVTAEFLYKTTEYRASEFERGIAWNAQTLGIQWLLQGEPALPVKDQQATPLAAAVNFA